ncbi:MAG TPA: alpha/beta hydrolase [Solirubrobacteraceae bacterium]|nr:alpha/beta hydrolase [Solirubrobacteraceae bacterium]
MAADTQTQALFRLGAEELARMPSGIHGLHRAIARRAFAGSGACARPARVLHDGISSAVYRGLSGAIAAGGQLAEPALARRFEGLPEAPRGAALIGIVNGLVGDLLEREGNPVAEPMAVRARDVPDPPTPRIAVFLHGLFETERSWRIGGREAYGRALAREHGWSALYVRYNSGRAIGANGRDLDALLEELVAGWPVPVERIALVGHSMGGLVARCACHEACERGASWFALTEDVVSLGAPHHGSPVAVGVAAAERALRALPETEGMGSFLGRRSAGVRDLQRGLSDDDYPYPDGPRYRFVAATLTRDPRHPVGRIVGDWLVRESSACGPDPEQVERIGGAGHFALLNHPQVAEHITAWLA